MVVPKIPIGKAATDSKQLVAKIGTTSPASKSGMSDGGKTIESCDDEDFF